MKSLICFDASSLIAASSLYYNYSLATINEKHFQNIEGLHLITPSSFQS